MKQVLSAKIIFPALLMGTFFAAPGLVLAQDVAPAEPAAAAAAAAPASAPEATPAAEESKPDAAAVTPAPEQPTSAPAVTPALKAKKKKKKEAEKGSDKTVEEPAKVDYHAGTPAALTDKLTMGTGFGLGGGTKTTFSQDYLGYYFYATYPISIEIIEGLKFVGEGRFTTHTGSTSKSDLNYVAMGYLVGASAIYKIAALPKLSVAANLLAGLVQTREENVVTHGRKSRYGGAISLGIRTPYGVYEKIDVVPGMGFVLGKSTRMDLQVGAQARF